MRKITTYDQMKREVLRNTRTIVDGVSVPMLLESGYSPLRVYPLTRLNDYKHHHRLRVFYEKGCKCVSCDREGSMMIVGMDPSGSWHLDLYTSDFVLMTVDHIHPKSRGGSNHIDNLQPMCRRCNTVKGDKVCTTLMTIPKPLFPIM